MMPTSRHGDDPESPDGGTLSGKSPPPQRNNAPSANVFNPAGDTTRNQAVRRAGRSRGMADASVRPRVAAAKET